MERLSRRSFIGVASAMTLGAAMGCVPQPAPSTNAAGGARQSGTRGSGALPSFIPFTGGPAPDVKSSDPRVVDAFEHFPRTPFRSWTKEPPGSGGRVDVLIAAYYPPPTSYDQNLTWQKVNKQLNTDLRMNIIPATDWSTKFATTMAGGDLPDIIHIYFGVPWVPNTVPFIQSQAADLTPYLAGDAIKDYPNLGAIPTYAWQNSFSALDGTLYQWPIHRYLPGLSYFFKNTDIYNNEIGADYVPRDAPDLRKGVNDILFNRRPMSDFDQLVKDWRNAAGDKMRQDYMAAMST